LLVKKGTLDSRRRGWSLEAVKKCMNNMQTGGIRNLALKAGGGGLNPMDGSQEKERESNSRERGGRLNGIKKL